MRPLMVYHIDLRHTSVCRRSMFMTRIWPVGQVVKTEASHAFNIGSNPVRVTKNSSTLLWGNFLLVLPQKPTGQGDSPTKMLYHRKPAEQFSCSAGHCLWGNRTVSQYNPQTVLPRSPFFHSKTASRPSFSDRSWSHSRKLHGRYSLSSSY